MATEKRLAVPLYSCVLLCKEDQVLLIQRAQTGYLDGYWAVPGGSVDMHETAVESAVREMREELNVLIDPADALLSHVLHIYPPAGNSLGFYFVVKNWQGEPENLEPHKHSAMQWFAFDALPAMLAPSARQVIEYVQPFRGLQFSVSSEK